MKTLKAGDKLKAFQCMDDQGRMFDSESMLGKKWILFFYPRASTPGCTAEACRLRDSYQAFKSMGYEIVGASADSIDKQKKFKEKYEFQYPLLADVEKLVINIFGVWGPKKFMGKTYEGIHRMTFVIDEKGIITQVVDKVKTKTHDEQLMALLK